MWNKLETLYASKLGNNKLFLLKQAMNLRYKEGTSISDHLSEFQGCFDQLSSMGVKFEDKILELWLFNTLPNSWENLRVTLTNSAPSGVVTMDFVKTAISNEEVRRQTQQTSSSQAEILVTEDRGEVEMEIRMEVIEANQSLCGKPLSATIVARKAIFKNIVIS